MINLVSLMLSRLAIKVMSTYEWTFCHQDTENVGQELYLQQRSWPASDLERLKDDREILNPINLLKGP